MSPVPKPLSTGPRSSAASPSVSRRKSRSVIARRTLRRWLLEPGRDGNPVGKTVSDPPQPSPSTMVSRMILSLGISPGFRCGYVHVQATYIRPSASQRMVNGFSAEFSRRRFFSAVSRRNNSSPVRRLEWRAQRVGGNSWRPSPAGGTFLPRHRQRRSFHAHREYWGILWLPMLNTRGCRAFTGLPVGQPQMNHNRDLATPGFAGVEPSNNWHARSGTLRCGGMHLIFSAMPTVLVKSPHR